MNKESLILGYFEKNLSPEEQDFFDQLMKTDKAFADAVRFEEQTKIALTLESRDKLKSQLQSYEAERKKKPRNNRWLYVAASIAILLGVWMFIFTQQPSNTQLYATYFEPYPNTVAPIVRGSENNADNQKAFVAYEGGDFDTAIVLFESLANTSQVEYAYFYKAMSLMAVEKYEEAQDLLTSTLWTAAYQEKAKWYLALNSLHLNRLDETKSILKEIVQSNSYNHKNASELLKKLP